MSETTGNGRKSFADWLTGTYRALMLAALGAVGWFAQDKLGDINRSSQSMVLELRQITQKIVDSDSRQLAIEGRVTTIEAERSKLLPFRYTSRDAEADFKLRDARDNEQDRRIGKAEDRLDSVDQRLNRQGFILKPGEGVR